MGYIGPLTLTSPLGR